MDPLQQSMDNLQAKEYQLHADWSATHSKATTFAGQAYQKFADAGRAMKTTATGAAEKIAQLRADDTLFPAGRDRLIGETTDAARSQLKKLDEQQRVCLEILGRELSAAALPKLSRDREMPARDEARMILDGAADPVRAMAQLAKRGDDVAAVLVGSYGDSYLRARGSRTPREDHELVRLQAVEAGRRSQDAQVQKAATAYFALDALKGAAVVTRELAWHPLEQAGVKR
jgi:hypothetical protein